MNKRTPNYEGWNQGSERDWEFEYKEDKDRKNKKTQRKLSVKASGHPSFWVFLGVLGICFLASTQVTIWLAYGLVGLPIVGGLVAWLMKGRNGTSEKPRTEGTSKSGSFTPSGEED